MYHQYNRMVPEYPPRGLLRTIIDTDAACEIDDHWAIALAIMAPERFEIEGFVSAHIGDRFGRAGVQRSYDDIKLCLENAGVAGKYRVLRGSHPLVYSDEHQPSEGVDFIIDQVMNSKDERPLWIISLGTITNIASAYLKEPRIADKIRVVWHGRTQWPERCWNLNAYNDVKAVRIVFDSPIPFVLFDTGGGLTMSMEESEKRVAAHGKLGSFLHQIRHRHPRWQDASKGIFDLGDIAALIAPETSKWEMVPAPSVDWDLRYDHTHFHGNMIRVFDIDRDRTFQDFEERLAIWPKTKRK